LIIIRSSHFYRISGPGLKPSIRSRIMGISPKRSPMTQTTMSATARILLLTLFEICYGDDQLVIRSFTSFLGLCEPRFRILHGPALLFGEQVAKDMHADLALVRIIVTFGAPHQRLDALCRIQSYRADRVLVIIVRALVAAPDIILGFFPWHVLHQQWSGNIQYIKLPRHNSGP
jgi:hypothetical protein